jgi:hypothetical protein
MLGYLVLILFIFGPPILLFGIIQIRNKISDITKIPKEQIENLLKHRNSDQEIYDFIKDSSNSDEAIDLIIRYKRGHSR